MRIFSLKSYIKLTLQFGLTLYKYQILKNIAIFASGSGTNAENIIRYFRTSSLGKVRLVLCNRPDAGVLIRAKNTDIQSVIFNKTEFYESDKILNILLSHKIDLVVLAGFLWLVPGNLLKTFQGRMINIHPALLPAYGGKGMYGDKVHKEVINNHEKESGITIHFVNEQYDEGDILFQARCKIVEGESAESLAKKIHELEYKYFPSVIEDLLNRI